MRFNHFDFYREKELLIAWHAVRAKGKSGGIDNIEIEDLEPNIETEIKKLSSLLQNNR